MPPHPLRASALLLLAGCSGPLGPTPTLLGLEPDLACDAGDAVSVTVTGSGFAPVPARVLVDPVLAMPSLTLTRTGALDGAIDGVTAPSISLSTDDGSLVWMGADTLVFSASPAMGLVPGAWDVSLQNPDAQSATLPSGLLWAGPPAVTDVSPSNVCIEATEAFLTLTGGSFLVVGGVAPTVTVGASDPIPTTASDCAPLPGDRDGEVCATLTAVVDARAFPLGEVEVEVTNPDPAACATTSPASVTVTLPPTIDTVDPALTCASGGVVRLTGERFPEDPVVTVGGVAAASVTVIDPNTLDITLAEDTPEGVVDIVVSGADGCAATATLDLVGEPDVFFVDPPTLYNGLTIEVTAWLADITAEVTEVWITDADGAVTDLAFTWSADTPGRLVATVPAGLPAGDYALGMLEADGCGAELADAFTIADTLTVAIAALDPAFAWTYDDTPVSVLASDPIPSGEVGFVATPRLYVTPAGESTTGGALSGVDLRSDVLLTATVPAGLDPGVYDVLVANPDGTVGLLEAGLTVTEDAPPVVTSVSPPSLPNSSDGTVEIRGANFRDPTVTLTCEEDGVEIAAEATVVASTYTNIEAVIPSNDFGQAVCVVEVTNVDGSRASWAAISIRNPSENLFPWSVGTDMVVARRAPAAVAGRTTSVARWVYALGGDDGSAAGAFTSIERASVGVYGDLDAWEVLPGALPVPVTLGAAAIVRDFVYLVGGNDGVGPVATGWRARILDPDDVPRFDTLSIDDEGGLVGGDWVWRVAALYDATDTTNPGGESLPSDPIGVSLPSGGSFSVDLAWEPVDRAVGYRVYRSPVVDESGDEEWVGDTTTTSFLDDGIATDPTRVPLEAGALGEWVALPEMGEAREAPCVALAPDPIPDPEIVYLYVAGGLDEGPLDSVEVLDITVAGDDEQLVGEWTDAGVTLTDARWGCGAYAVDASRHSVVAEDETWIYVAGGEGASRTLGTVDVGRVGEGGALGDWQEIDSMSPARAGFGYASASDFLYAFGGQNAEPSSGGVSAELGIEPLPEVRNWNSLGTSLYEARFLPGSATESAVIVVLGGQTETAAATRSTDVTNW